MKPRIRSKEDLIAFLRQTINDEDMIKIIADVMEYTGRDGYIETQQGGDGAPFRIEYREVPRLDNVSMSEILSRIKRLKELQAHTASPTEKDALQRQIAELTGGLAIIWINVESDEEFQLKSKKLMNAYHCAKAEIG